MYLKVKVKSQLYKDEYLGIQYNAKTGFCEIGGKSKMVFECRNLIKKYFLQNTLDTKEYKNNISRICFECSNEDFMVWIDKLTSHGVGLQFVNTLGRIMR